MRQHPESRPRGDRNGSRVHPETVRRGEASNLARISDARRSEVCADLRAGMPTREAMEKYGLSESYIQRLRNGTRAAYFGKGARDLAALAGDADAGEVGA